MKDRVSILIALFVGFIIVSGLGCSYSSFSRGVEGDYDVTMRNWAMSSQVKSVDITTSTGARVKMEGINRNPQTEIVAETTRAAVEAAVSSVRPISQPTTPRPAQPPITPPTDLPPVVAFEPLTPFDGAVRRLPPP